MKEKRFHTFGLLGIFRHTKLVGKVQHRGTSPVLWTRLNALPPPVSFCPDGSSLRRRWRRVASAGASLM